MIDIVMPPRHQIYIELKPYFDDEEWLLDLDDEQLFKAYTEMKFLHYGIIDPKNVGWEEV